MIFFRGIVFKKGKIFILLFLSFIFISCRSFDKKDNRNFDSIKKQNKKIEWIKIKDGIWISHLFYKNYPLLVHVLKIDLANTKLKITATEPEMFDLETGTVKRESTLKFAKRNNTDVAISAGFFKTKSILFSFRAKPLGVHIYNSRILNNFNKAVGGLYFLKDNTAKIVDTQNKKIDKNILFAVSGLKMILKNGKPIRTNLHHLEDSRTCVGVDGLGKILYFVFIEGENKLKSRGVTYDQAAFFIQKVGATDAIHLDGGGSSSLVVKKGDKFFVEVPSITSITRKVATNLGFIIEN